MRILHLRALICALILFCTGSVSRAQETVYTDGDDCSTDCCCKGPLLASSSPPIRPGRISSVR